MDFSFKDDEMAGPNMQHKRLFDGTADVDSNSMKLLSDDWTLDSIFALNNDFLQELSDLGKFDEANTLSDRLSPFSTGTESENDHEFLSSQTSSLSTTMETPMLSPQQNYSISSSSSDSGLSTDNIDFDMNADYDILGSELLQKAMNPSLVIPSPRQMSAIARKKESNVTLAPPSPAVPVAAPVPAPAQAPAPAPAPAPVQPKQQENQIVFDEMQYLQPIDNNNRVECIQTIDNVNELMPKHANRKIQIVKKLATNLAEHQNVTLKFQKPITTGETVLAPGTPFVINKMNGNISGIRKVIHVKKGPNKNSILLPVSFKNGTDIRSIKIIKPSAMTTKSPKILMAASTLLQEYKQNEMMKNITTPAPKQTTTTITAMTATTPEQQRYDDSMSDPSDNESYKFEDMFVQDDDDDDDDDDGFDDHIESEQHIVNGKTEYPKLMLSGEEKRLLAKEGISLPAHYPLTKHEERELKRIRRKIRNKISAQDSRKRKKEYVDGLEERVKKCTDENQTLLKRIKLLQSQNQNLIAQMKKMQGLLTRGGNKTAQPATCLMVLLLSMALIAYPNMQLKDSKEVVSDILMKENELQYRRSLLFDSHEKFSDVLVDEEMANDLGSFYSKAENNDHDYAETPILPTSLDKKIGQLIDFDVDDTVWVPPPNNTKQNVNGAVHHTSPSHDFTMNGGVDGGVKRERQDAYGAGAPPTKIAKNNSDSDEHTNSNPKTFDLRLDDIPNVIKLTTTNLSPKEL